MNESEKIEYWKGAVGDAADGADAAEGHLNKGSADYSQAAALVSIARSLSVIADVVVDGTARRRGGRRSVGSGSPLSADRAAAERAAADRKVARAQLIGRLDSLTNELITATSDLATKSLRPGRRQ